MGGNATTIESADTIAATKKRLLTNRRILVLIMVAAAAIRIITALGQPMIQGDQLVYARMAESLAAGNGLLDLTGVASTHFTPLLSIFMAGLSFLVGDVILSGYTIVIFFETIVMLPVYLLGRDIISPRVGLMAAALAAVMPLIVDYSSQIYSEGVYVFFLLFAVYYGWCMLRNGRPACAALTGLALGMAYLANPAATFYLVAFSALAFAAGIYRRSLPRMLTATAVFLLVFAALAAPYVVFLHNELGRWTYSNKNVASNLYAAIHNQRLVTPELEQKSMALNDEGTEVKDMEMADDATDPLSFLLRQPRQGVSIFFQDATIFYFEEMPKVLPLWFLPLLGLGLFAGTWDRRRALAAGYTLMLMLPVLMILAIDYRRRFFVPFVMLLVVWIALGWSRFEEWGIRSVAACFSERASRRWRTMIIWTIAVCILLPPLMMSAQASRSIDYPVQYKETGEWMRRELGPGKRIMDRVYTVAYYAGGIVVLFPFDSYERTTAYAFDQDVDYLVIQKKNVESWRPGMAPLLEEESQHPEWRLVRTVRPGTREETLIFELMEQTESNETAPRG